MAAAAVVVAEDFQVVAAEDIQAGAVEDIPVGAVVAAVDNQAELDKSKEGSDQFPAVDILEAVVQDTQLPQSAIPVSEVGCRRQKTLKNNHKMK